MKGIKVGVSLSKYALSLGVILALVAIRVDAHAVLENSSPEIDSTVTGPNIAISLTFNVRVDAARSRVRLLFPNATLIDLTAQQDSQGTLVTKASGLQPGSYTILWQVLAPDGHISRGEIPFKVATP